MFTNVVIKQGNEHYNPDKRWNGGGYDQPIIHAVDDQGVKLYIMDTSCGDFGSRVYVKYGDKSAYYGSMVQQDSSDFTEDDGQVLDAIWMEFGYRVPTKEEVEYFNEEP